MKECLEIVRYQPIDFRAQVAREMGNSLASIKGELQRLQTDLQQCNPWQQRGILNGTEFSVSSFRKLDIWKVQTIEKIQESIQLLMEKMNKTVKGFEHDFTAEIGSIQEIRSQLSTTCQEYLKSNKNTLKLFMETKISSYL